MADSTETERLRHALTRAREDLQRISYVVSHDLWAPLRAIEGFSSLLAEEVDVSATPKAAHYFSRVHGGVASLQSMLDDLTQYSRVETRGEPKGPVDLNTSLRDALHHLKPLIDERQADVQADALPTVSADGKQMMLVFAHLLENALKFCESTPRVHITAHADQDGHRIAVRDNGIGVNAHHCESVFDVFRRLHPVDAYPGNGIGLALVKRIVDRHEGRVWIEPTPESGSTVHFTIPS